jgi:Domain of unknown function (DUF4956)
MSKRRGPVRRVWDNLAARTILYYVVILGALTLWWHHIPASVRELLLTPAASTPPSGGFGRAAEVQVVSQGSVAPAAQMFSVGAAMSVAALLTLPIAWLYILTRHKKGFRQSMVHTLIILPVVVGGVVVLVKNSLALAFSLTGIVAAVRFRNTLEDSKDAVYIFVATAIGLAAGVAPPVSLTISLIYNVVILALWYSDFGRTSASFEGPLAQQRLEAVRQFAGRESGFISQLDEEVLKSLSPEQLDVLSDRARKRRGQAAPDVEPEDEPKYDVLLRVRTRSTADARLAVEPVLDDRLKKWRFRGVVTEPDGDFVLEYAVRLRKKMTPTTLCDALQEINSPHVLGVEAQ